MTERLQKGSGISSAVTRVTLWGLVANLVLSGLKMVGGIVGGSQAMVADAIHSLSDSVTDVAILFGVRFWSAPPDERHPYGHWRIETLITTGIGLLLVVLSIGIMLNALQDIQRGTARVPSWLAFWAAMVSLVTKELLYRWTAYTGRRLNSSAMVANAWHHRSDALSSIPAACAILTARFKPDWTFVDPLGAIAVSGFVLYAAWHIIRSASGDLTDEAAPEPLLADVKMVCEKMKDVSSVHNVRSRKVGPGYNLDLHVLVNPELSVRQGHDIATLVKHRLIEQIPQMHDVVVHIEPDDE